MWRVEVVGTGDAVVRQLVLVDAANGAVALSVDQVAKALDRLVCDFRNEPSSSNRCRYAADPVVYRDGLPRVGEGLARWCVGRGVKLLGVESPSVADVNNRDELTRVHRILLGGGVVIVEGLTNLGGLRDREGWFVAAPLKVEGGDGCPCRAFVVLPEPSVGVGS